VIVGIVGGIASGKSTVTRTLVELGAEHLDADRMAHEILEHEDVRDTLRSWWGDSAFAADGSVDRKAIGARVFASADERTRLESLVHPRVREALEAGVREYEARDKSDRAALLVLDIPLLAASPLRAHCDEIVFVDTPDAQRAERARARGWDDGELARREAAQTPLHEKRQLATRVIDNSAGETELRRRVEELHEALAGISTEGSE